MTRIERIIEVTEDREITLKLPPEIEVGSHRVTLLVDASDLNSSRPAVDHRDQPSDPRVVDDDGLLVITGAEPGESERILQALRDERERAVLGGRK
jgi:hypothetical protein